MVTRKLLVVLLACGTAAATDADAPPQGQARRMLVTAYCPCKQCCGKEDGITASGKSVKTNGGRFVAADPTLPFHTKLTIPGYADDQPVPVLDRGGAIKGNRLDVFFPTHKQARQWGKQWVDVTVWE